MKKITQEIQNKIVSFYEEGKTVADIGRELGLDAYGTVSKTLRHRGVKILPQNPSLIYKVNENYFENIDQEDKAYWLGFLMADGYIRQRIQKNKRKYTVRLTLKESDHMHIKKFADYIAYSGDIKFATRACSNGVLCKMAYVEICRKKMHDDLTKHGCIQNKSLILEFPLHIDKKWQRDIIRGYFDGDGSIYKQRDRNNDPKYYAITICSGSHNFITACQNILFEESIDNNISQGAGVEILRIRSKSHEKFYHYLYDKSTTYLDRKRDIFIEMATGLEWQLD